MSRAEKIAAALERWEKASVALGVYSHLATRESLDSGDALARLLCESQPEPAVGDDEALLAQAEWFCRVAEANGEIGTQELVDELAASLRSLRAALSDVARLRSQLELQRTAIRSQEERHRAALAAAEAEEREACRMIAANYALNSVDAAGRYAANIISERIRARAGRNDG